MNENEIARIAAAMNHLRPDWPVKQLRTLIRDHMADRPRRDVAVALAWIACESGTANPYRVLESGPWWRAAAIEGQAQRREVLNPVERCGICAKPESRCQSTRIADDDHAFEPDVKRDTSTDIPRVVQALREVVAPAPVIAAKTPDEQRAKSERRAELDRMREADRAARESETEGVSA